MPLQSLLSHRFYLVVADAVAFEPVSTVQFLANREIISEFLEFWLLQRHLIAQSLGRFNGLP